ncbi:MAG TPA: hypothetical protein PK004_04360 [Smithella sp.]|nr:hypothetical protein [Smithella sp.]
MKDTIFKMCIIVIGIAFLIIYFFHSQNGRFYKIDDGVMDTRTGTYFVNIRTESGFESINFTTGKVNIYDVQVTDKRQNREPAPLVEAPVAPAPAPAPESTGPAPEAN